MSNILFEEKQKMDNIWALTILALVSVVNWILYFMMGYEEMTFFYTSLLVASILSFIISKLTLYTKISPTTLYYKLTPFHFHYSTISRSDIVDGSIRQYKWFSEYGRRGKAKGKSGKAITISGNFGLQLKLKSGELILFGTSQPEKLKDILKKNWKIG
ncbi:MAG: hypothetical protein WAU01_03640 [Saprospiraceae bacterium]